MAATGHEHPGTAAYGIALLSRFPVASWQLVRLPQIPMRFPMYLPGPNRAMIVDEEPRAAVIAQLHTPLGTLTWPLRICPSCPAGIGVSCAD
jgi:hypothetical protein